MKRGTQLAAARLHTGQNYASSRWQPQRLPPATILTQSSGNWGHPDTLTDGTLALGGDKPRVYTWHCYEWDHSSQGACAAQGNVSVGLLRSLF